MMRLPLQNEGKVDHTEQVSMLYNKNHPVSQLYYGAYPVTHNIRTFRCVVIYVPDQ